MDRTAVVVRLIYLRNQITRDRDFCLTSPARKLAVEFSFDY